MDLVGEKVSLVAGNLKVNYAFILAWALMLALDEGDDPEGEVISDEVFELESGGVIQRRIARFSISSMPLEQPLSVEVVSGKFKTAMLLYYLSREHHRGESSFSLSKEDREFIKLYFSLQQVEDALHNEKTEHTTLRALLSEGEVRVSINAV